MWRMGPIALTQRQEKAVKAIQAAKLSWLVIFLCDSYCCIIGVAFLALLVSYDRSWVDLCHTDHSFV